MEKIPGDFKSRIPVTVSALPFYLGKNLLSTCDNYLKQGLNAYHKNNYNESKELLNKALSLYPRFASAVEALAIIEERLGNIEEAIELNKCFAELDPNDTIAHTNLSRLYMKKGWKEKAEEELKQATLLSYKFGQTDYRKIQKKLEKQELSERRKKIKMFQDILAIDPKDEIAHFGLGNMYYKLKQYQEAISHIKIVLEQNPEYSAAYDILTKSLIALGRESEALPILNQGIEIATKRGDLSPERSMREKLRQIEAGSKKASKNS